MLKPLDIATLCLRIFALIKSKNKPFRAQRFYVDKIVRVDVRSDLKMYWTYIERRFARINCYFAVKMYLLRFTTRERKILFPKGRIMPKRFLWKKLAL